MNKRQQWFRNSFRNFVIGTAVFCPAALAAQQTNSTVPPQSHPHPQQGIYLVFPFENAGAPPRLDWIGEGLEELTIQWLSNSGQAVYSHEGRLNEMDRYGLPATAKLSRATMLHVAQELDADYVVFGTFTSDAQNLTVNARVLRVSPVALLPLVRESAPLETLIDLQSKVIWRLLATNDRNYYLSLAEFNKRQRPMRLDAFEQYIRGLLANDDEIRLRDLKEASRLEPEWPEPAFALGEVYYARNDCASALPWFAKVPASHDRSVEAVFATGVCRLRLNQPDKAELVFSSLQQGLQSSSVSGADLPEILNNLALAEVRQGNYPPARMGLSRARDIDPDEDDYPFNLGLLALQQNEMATAATHFADAVHREPDNAEDMAFLIYALDKAGKKTEADEQRGLATEAFGEKGLPSLKIDAKADSLNKYERVKHELDTTMLRLDLEDPQERHLAGGANGASGGGSTGGVGVPGVVVKETPAQYVRHGRQELNAGRLDAAEREFRAALALDPNDATAHREMAEIDRRRGRLDDAVLNLNLSLAARDSAAVRVMLARIYMEQKKTDLARAEVEKAVKLAPNYPEAKELLEHLDKGKGTGGAK
jgi:tetratricopeptide (TPR) repeat protein